MMMVGRLWAFSRRVRRGGNVRSLSLQLRYWRDGDGGVAAFRHG